MRGTLTINGWEHEVSLTEEQLQAIIDRRYHFDEDCGIATDPNDDTLPFVVGDGWVLNDYHHRCLVPKEGWSVELVMGVTRQEAEGAPAIVFTKKL